MAGLGLFFASVLALVNQKLKVKEDPKLEEITALLPGVNCGACGFASCHLYAEALIKEEALVGACKAGGVETAENLSEILGIAFEKKTKEIAILHCGADTSKRKKKATYVGIKTCIAAHNLAGGEILCEYGCLGYGDCQEACPFGAVILVKGLPRIDKNKCTACGKCVAACPRGLITIENMLYENLIHVACNNSDPGSETRKTCPIGCIACGICQKLTGGIFKVENNLATVDYEKMKDIKNPEEIAKKCPAKCIVTI